VRLSLNSLAQQGLGSLQTVGGRVNPAWCRADHRRDRMDPGADHECSGADGVLLDDDGQPVRLGLRHLSADDPHDDPVTYLSVSATDHRCLSPGRARSLVGAVESLLG
jgi:hypothetical protein